jgi:hypothetical protein
MVTPCPDLNLQTPLIEIVTLSRDTQKNLTMITGYNCKQLRYVITQVLSPNPLQQRITSLLRTKLYDSLNKG